MDLKLKGKKAIVTGATRGIGRAIAEVLAAEGADVVICARKAGEVEKTAADLKSLGVNAVGGVADIADGAGFTAWIERAAEALGGLDILICNASALAQGNTEAAWQAGFEIDVLGAQRAIGAALPFLLRAAEASGDAAVTVVSSVSAAETTHGNAYGAMKAAQIHLVKGLAKQHAPKGLRFNTVSPGTIYFEGGVWGDMEKTNPEIFKASLGRNPMGRMGRPEEIARAAVFLSSPASSFTTGINMVVDGAITSRVNF
jgi:3-oxoacyl-[acyl-carrier protein] reductase